MSTDPTDYYKFDNYVQDLINNSDLIDDDDLRSKIREEIRDMNFTVEVN